MRLFAAFDDKEVGRRTATAEGSPCGGKIAQRSRHPRSAFRGMTNPLHKRHHEDKQARKNVQCTKVGMTEFKLWLDQVHLRGYNNTQFVQQDGVIQGDGGLRNFQREEWEEESYSNNTDIQEG
ncbi:hypothetical protein BHM03_00053465 [Ensete ventricosum]|nr:hypothetical protein BHM03_00053465 [Ensete ventricosum]